MAKVPTLRSAQHASAQRPRDKSGLFTKQPRATANGPLHKPTMTITQQTTNETATEASQLVTIKESQTLVQTLVMDCVSSLTRSRYMFPPQCYEQRFVSYTDSKTSKPTTQKDRASEPQGQALLPQGRSFFALKRGSATRVDRLIHLMEHGVLDAIKHGFLKAIRFAIFEHPDRPDDRLEEWTLAISYSVDASTGVRVMSGVNLSAAQQGKNITITQAKNSLGRFMQDLATYTFFLPQLPDVVQMTIELDFLKDTPADYCPPDFGISESDASHFPDTDEWENITVPIGKMDTGPHRVSLVVAHLRRRDGEGPNIVPSGLTCTKEVPRDAGIDLSLAIQPVVSAQDHTSSLVANSHGKAADIHHCSSPRTLGNDTDYRSAISYKSVRPSSTQSLQQEESNPVRHPSTNMRIKEQIVRMLPARTVNTSVEETQMLNASRSVDDERSERVTFMKSKINFLDDNMDIDIPLREGDSKIIGVDQITDQDVSIQCDCQDSVQGESVIHCQFCDHYQHLSCYGYQGATDARIPAIHICYNCLLAEDDAQQLAVLRDKVRCRRVLCLLQKTNKVDNRRKLSKDLGWTESLCAQIQRTLQTQGLLMARRNKNQIILNPSEETKASINAIYFNPRFGIERYLQSYSEAPLEPATPCKTSEPRTKRLRDGNNAANHHVKKPCTSRRLLTSFTIGPDYSTPKTSKKHQ
ncbi:HORMA domain-containing protein [Phaeosphaeriaceae sp. PMI808]|nr:HORMA domain-containing protein [Phaeosphaeriaceae sp. PMI808]